jgi:hypothetical protein
MFVCLSFGLSFHLFVCLLAHQPAYLSASVLCLVAFSKQHKISTH